MSDRGQVASLRGSTWRLRRPGAATPFGHQKITLGESPRRHRWVHRLILEAFVGAAPGGHVARHLNGDPSDNRLVNLAWGTATENGADMVAHGRSTRGSKNSSARLSEVQAREIFAARGVESATALAMQYGVSRSTIYAVWSGAAWGWLTDAG